MLTLHDDTIKAIKLAIVKGGATLTHDRPHAAAREGDDYGRFVIAVRTISTVRTRDLLEDDKAAWRFVALALNQAAKERYTWLGLWNNGGLLHIEASIRAYDAHEAVKIARLFKQLYIYDLRTKKAIEVPQ